MPCTGKPNKQVNVFHSRLEAADAAIKFLALKFKNFNSNARELQTIKFESTDQSKCVKAEVNLGFKIAYCVKIELLLLLFLFAFLLLFCFSKFCGFTFKISTLETPP